MAIEKVELKHQKVRKLFSNAKPEKSHIPVSTLIECISSLASSSVYLYDLATQLGIGTLLKDLQSSEDGAQVIEMETRDGAGLVLAGRLSGQSSKDFQSSVITAYTTPSGFARMTGALVNLDKPAKTSTRLIVQIPNVSVLPSSLSFSPSLAPTLAVLHALPEHISVIVSSNSQEALSITQVAYSAHDTHVVHIFDHYASTREERNVILPSLSSIQTGASFEDSSFSLGYKYFEYAGPEDPDVVVVMVNGPLFACANALVSSASSSKLGLVGVRVLKPWNAAALKETVPSSVKKLYVIEDISDDYNFANGYLYTEVFSTFFDPANLSPSIESLGVTACQLHTYINDPIAFKQWFASVVTTKSEYVHTPTKCKKLIFCSSPTSALAMLPTLITDVFSASRAVQARHLATYDIFSKPGGLLLDRILTSPAKPAESLLHDSTPLPFLMPSHSIEGQADFLVITDQTLLKSHAMLSHAKSGGTVLLLTTWDAEELYANLNPEVFQCMQRSQLRIYTFNAKECVKGISEASSDVSEVVMTYMAFMRLYFGGDSDRRLVETLAEMAFDSIRVPLSKMSAQVWQHLYEFDHSISGAQVSGDLQIGDTPSLQHFSFNSMVPMDGEDLSPNSGKAKLSTWSDAAKHILFREAYKVPVEGNKTPSLRPDLQEETFLITCTVNRRLTPLSYNRNVFHLEFDTSGTGLKYAIGEALGVHGWNDDGDVVEFCKWYGIDPSEIITLPIPESGGVKLHSRTVFQALQQQIDIFGRPPKSFYASLAEHATSREDRMALLFIAAPEGAATFKKMNEKDTVTFADVLQHFHSARPKIEELVELVGDIKPRHYSIASAMSAVGDRVDLLVVTVDWITPSGSPRYGQCTRYLAGLKLGQKVTVSIKPSVMKLPPDDLQPIIMAGLGTGAAPFRAFMQHRALLVSKGVPTGPLLYYFGSRHRSEEYLYGEEIEAYLASSVITHAGLAFSRDSKEKVYIQHKMKEDAQMLVKMLRRDKGVFYLCGPTWPVPDVYETLVSALVRYEKEDADIAAEYLESLKEEERYVLEVY